MSLEAFTDADVVFFVQTHGRDLDRLDWLLAHVRAHYPFARIEVVGDGDRGVAEVVAKRYSADYTSGDALFGLANGGQIIRRMLMKFTDKPGRWLVKVDTDTGVYRRFAGLPRDTGVYGTLQMLPMADRAGECWSVQGGCIIVTRTAAVALLDKGLLDDPRLASAPNETWALSHLVRETRVAKGLTSEDWVLAWACGQAEVWMYSHPEVMSRWQAHVENVGDRYAVTHPCKSCRLL